MKKSKILFFVVIALLPLVLVSCSSIFGGAQVSGGWAGTVFRDGIIYASSRDGRVVAINSSTQIQSWNYTITPATTIYATPIMYGDLVYVGTYSGKVYALSVADGEDIWVYPREGYMGAIVGSPVIGNGTIYISSSDGKVYAINATSGKRKWETDSPLADKLWTSPVVYNDKLYLSTFDGHIYALSVETGALNWSFKSEVGFASSPVIYGDTIYVGSFDRHLYAVKIGNNVSMWKFPQEKPAGNWFWASPIVNDDIVYAGCLDGKLYAIEAKTGEELWEFDTGDPIVSSPVLMDNLLIVANEAGNVYVINPETREGERIRNPENDNKPTINAQIKASLCAHEGLVYIRDEDNWVYVVDIDKGEVSWKISLTIGE
jgi:outer membrane protein assembly factor BamB